MRRPYLYLLPAFASGFAAPAQAGPYTDDLSK